MTTGSSVSRALLLFLAVKLLADTVHCKESPKNHRHKREWVLPAKKLMENVDYTKHDYIAQIGSDIGGNLRYSLKGPGADEPPYNLFVVEENTGRVRITDMLDREKIAQYNLVGVAWYKNNTIAEEAISLPFVVADQNDNPPEFIKPEPANIYEGSPAGTFVTQIIATDADESNTPHSKIAFSIIKQEPSSKQYFAIDKDSGFITVKDPSLDREATDTFTLTVKASDMGGAAGGNSATSTVKIHVLDINDNVPTLEKDEYAVSVDENVADIEVLRVQALDKDEERTDNWLAVFEIVSGNEEGYFMIKSDENTNEGVLYLVKPVDFEAVPNLNLNVALDNKAPPGAAAGMGSGGGAGAGTGGGGSAGGHGTGAGTGGGGSAGGHGTGAGTGSGGGTGTGSGTGSGGGTGTGSGTGSGAGTGTGSGTGTGAWTGGGPGGAGRPGTYTIVKKGKTYLIKVMVNNRPDGPKYGPNPKIVPISENPKGGSIPRVIATYPAMDGDTGKQAAKVSYAKGHDPGNWLSIDENTAEIKLNKMPDRESPHVINGTYYAKILCITDDLPAQTATGTIALQVEDINDNCPTLLSKVQHVCSGTPAVNVTAVDSDAHPNGAPLQFLVIPEETKGKWQVNRTSGSAALLLPQQTLWPGSYKVSMEIKDQQGLACPDKQILNIMVCTCSEGGTCGLQEAGKPAAVKAAATASFGALGIGVLLLGFLALLLVLGLLLSCSCGNAGGGGGLPKYFADIPFDTKEYLIPYHTEGRGEDREVPLLSVPISVLKAEAANVQASMAGHNFKATDYSVQQTGTMGMSQEASREDYAQYLEDDMALSDVFLEKYFIGRARCEAEPAAQKEALLVYNYEGQGSSTSSLSSEGLFEMSEDLEFLNDLGPKFTTLAQICGFTCPELEPVVSKVITETISSNPAQVNAFREPVLPKTIIENSATTDMTMHITSEGSTDDSSSSHLVKMSSELIAESPPATVLVSENTFNQDHMLVVQEPMYYMVEQVPSTVLLTRQASAGLGQGMFLVNGMAGAEELILQQNYNAEGNLSARQHVVVNGDSEKSFTINQSAPNSKSLLRQKSIGWMLQGSISGKTGSEGIAVTNGHSVVGQTSGLTSAVVGHSSGLNNGTLLNGEHVVIMDNAAVPGHVVLGERMNGLNQSLVQNVSPAQNFVQNVSPAQNFVQNVSPAQNFIMVQGQLSPTQLQSGGTFQMGLQGLNHGEIVLVNESEQDRMTFVENPGQIIVGSQASQAQLQPLKVSTLQRGTVLGTSDQAMIQTNKIIPVEGSVRDR